MSFFDNLYFQSYSDEDSDDKSSNQKKDDEFRKRISKFNEELKGNLDSDVLEEIINFYF